MGRDLLRSLFGSKPYTVIRALGTERVLLGVLAAFVLASAVSVFRSNPAAGIEFLSFVLVFVPLAVLIDRAVEASTE